MYTFDSHVGAPTAKEPEVCVGDSVFVHVCVCVRKREREST